MAYELWGTESANLIADFPTEDDALTAVHEALQAGGPSVIAQLAFAYEDDEGETHPLAEGSALADRAQRSTSMR